jgi:hypothetical protein
MDGNLVGCFQSWSTTESADSTGGRNSRLGAIMSQNLSDESSGCGGVMCPSSKCEEGAILLGVVMQDGHVAFPSDRLPIDSTFVQIARRGRSPEKRFRFAGRCVKSACKQWVGSRCSVIDKVMSDSGTSEKRLLPECSIRTDCRWFLQSGEAACAVCPLIITDLREDHTRSIQPDSNIKENR